ncbi:DUF5702 domain-containing protein [Lachnospiraceae bacterium 48-42]
MREYKFRELRDTSGERGEVTAALSLIFILLMTFAASMLESTSMQNAKNYCRADVNRAVECLFAEYQKELLEEYEVFALEGTYETGTYDEKLLFDRLAWYGAGNMSHQIIRIQFLTDSGGQAFYEQAAAYMEHKYGIDRAKKYLGETASWDQQVDGIRDYVRQEQENGEKLKSLLEENEGEIPKEDNPVEHVNTLKNTPLLTLVTPKDMQLSEKSLAVADTASHRKRNTGFGDFSDVPETAGAVQALLFGEYIMEHFAMAADGKSTGVLDYQAEYILEGKPSDKENLEAVVRRLLRLRLVSNYACIQTDSVKKAEAAALAATLCSLLAVPAITETAAQALIFAWAYGESVVDIRSLLKGNRVPLVKTGDSWQLQLSGILKLGTEEDQNDGADTEGGLRYKDYLRILLFLGNKKKEGMRTLDLIEQNLRTEKGQSYFRADYCISKIELKSTRIFRRGISYQFPTCFGYH